MGLNIELEEWVGHRWHRWAANAASFPHHTEAAVPFESVRGAIGTFFRLAGGESGLAVMSIAEWQSSHRLSLRQRLGQDHEQLAQTRSDENHLLLPATIDVFTTRSLNRDLYFWLAGFMATTRVIESRTDPLQQTLQELREIRRATEATLALFPGFRERYCRLCAATREAWPRHRKLPDTEAAIQLLQLNLLGEDSARGPLFDTLMDDARDLSDLSAPRGYRPPLPVPLWGTVSRARAAAEQGPTKEVEPSRPAASAGRLQGMRKARRKQQSQSERNDPLIFNRFEKMLSFADMVDVNRMTDEDEDENAANNADQMDELTLSSRDTPAAATLDVDVDLAPSAVIADALPDDLSVAEWDYRQGCYLPNQSRIIVSQPESSPELSPPDALTRRRIRRVKRQFEAFRPKRTTRRAQSDGTDIDLDALVSHRSELASGNSGEGKVYLQDIANERDLAVNVLVDNSLSTDAWIEDCRVIDVARDAVMALAQGLERLGDEYAITSFTSHRRLRVQIGQLKSFDERLDSRIEGRIAALEPGAYTRMGPAIRYAAQVLNARPQRHKLLLLLSDGKPSDTDYYDGRYAIEDTRQAVLDTRRAGTSVFAITIDREAANYLPYLFGPGAWSLVRDLSHLIEALPRIYRQITSG